jgi:hypothetical protein
VGAPCLGFNILRVGTQYCQLGVLPEKSSSPDDIGLFDSGATSLEKLTTFDIQLTFYMHRLYSHNL